ncbi:GNAT family N-acetyltransferase [Massilia sp. DJPM01]|uniref:GNAT family N-acetyltransferase n=1 Tax=Massilia sp. DJPM01 TaxID=3024404 RepID=UPI0035A2D6B7
MDRSVSRKRPASPLSPIQLVQYVDQNFNLFASDRDDKFPANLIGQVSGPSWAAIRREEGFAIVFKGRNELFGGDGENADLMFLHVLPEFQGKGIGTQIIEEAKAMSSYTSFFIIKSTTCA